MYTYDVPALCRPRFAMALNKNHAFPWKYLFYMVSRLISFNIA